MEKNLGHKQQKIIEIGEELGFITPEHIIGFYKNSEIQRQMYNLCNLGYFKEKLQRGSIIWIYIKDENSKVQSYRL